MVNMADTYVQVSDLRLKDVRKLLIFVKVISSPSWSQTCYVAKGDLELLVSLPLPMYMVVHASIPSAGVRG